MNPTILVVDDEPTTRKILSNRLTKEGFKTTTCGDGDQCLSFIESIRVDLILLDIMMPGLNGLDVLRIIRQKYQRIELPVIIVTSVEEKPSIIEALNLGANDYISKPVNLEIIIARIRAHLDAAQFYRESIIKQKIETIHSLVVTYNHEIINPLSIAMAEVETAIRRGDLEKLPKAYDALKRISAITKKIQKLTGKEIKEAVYVDGRKMVKLDPATIIKL